MTPDGIRDYSYDGLGRLTLVVDKDAGGVETVRRAYGFDANTNRVSLTTTPVGQSATTVTYTYDSADQLTSVTGGPMAGSYTYDANGNTLTMPNTSLVWSGDNRVESITKTGTTVSYGLDALGRVLSRSDGSTASTYHYVSDGDSADWVVDGSVTTRYVGVGGGLSAVHQVGGTTSWLLTSPHGDVWAHTDAAGNITATYTFDEYGVPTGGTATGVLGKDRYGWLGSQQRETDPTTGLITMGVAPSWRLADWAWWSQSECFGLGLQVSGVSKARTVSGALCGARRSYFQRDIHHAAMLMGAEASSGEILYWVAFLLGIIPAILLRDAIRRSQGWFRWLQSFVYGLMIVGSLVAGYLALSALTG